MAATGAAAARGEGIPLGSACLEIRLRTVTPPAGPSARRRRTPAAARTADAIQLIVALTIGDVGGDAAASQIVVQQQQRCAPRQAVGFRTTLDPTLRLETHDRPLTIARIVA